MTSVKDWQTGKALPDRLHYMLTNEMMCDVTFLVGPERTPVKAHKFMLSSASPVFHSMFNGPMSEQGDVIIPDLEVNDFKDILKFIYTDEVKVKAENIKGLFYGSEKYIIDVLKNKCTSFLKNSVNTEHACAVLQTAHDLHIDRFKEEVLQFILKNGKDCLSSKAFLMLSQEFVKVIIESDELHCPEELVYIKMVEWAKKRCSEQEQDITDENLRNALGKLLYLIRFPVIDHRYFTLNISKRCILTCEEIVKIGLAYYDDDSEPFSKRRRHFDKGAVQYIRCETDRKTDSNQTGNCDCLDFKINSDALICGIYVFGSKTYRGQHNVIVELVVNHSVTLGSVTTLLKSVRGQEIYLISFNAPIRLQKNTRYSIRLTMTGPAVFKGQNYKSVVLSENGRTVTFQTSVLPSPNGTSGTSGQIPGILLSSRI